MTHHQSQSRFVSSLGVGGPEAMMAQTFTAGLSGGLPRVDLAVNTGEALPNSPLAVELRSTSGGEPSDQVLATASVPAQPCCTSIAWVSFPPSSLSCRSRPARCTRSRYEPLTSRYPRTDGGSTRRLVRCVTFTRLETRGSSSPPGSGLREPAPSPATSPSGPTSTQGGVGAPGAPPGLAQSIAELKALLDRLGLPPGLTDRLQKMLDRVLAALPPGNTSRANRSLRAFGNRVAAQRGKRLTVAQARRLSAASRALRASLALKRLER
jgi:hypothetical protein